MQNWGKKSGYNCALLESFIGIRKTDIWNDFVAVFIKNEDNANKFKNRIQLNVDKFTNGRLLNSEKILNFFEKMQVDDNYFIKLIHKLNYKIKKLIEF